MGAKIIHVLVIIASPIPILLLRRLPSEIEIQQKINR